METLLLGVYMVVTVWGAGYLIGDTPSSGVRGVLSAWVIAALWPVWMVAYITHKTTGIYIGNYLQAALDRWERFRCDHENRESFTDIELAGTTYKHAAICHDCKKKWLPPKHVQEKYEKSE